MEVRKEETSNFYKTAVQWWSKHIVSYEGKKIPFPAIPESLLPTDVFIVSHNGLDLYSCFFYHTNSALAWVAYPISNLEATKEEREGAFEYLLIEMEIYAKKEGYFMMFTTSPIPNVIKALKSQDYIEGDLSVNQYFKPINQV